MKGRMFLYAAVAVILASGLFLPAPLPAAVPPCENLSISGNEDPHALLTRYWASRQSLREHFVRNDMDEEGNLLGDGIGQWDPGRRVYDKAGFGMTANYLIMTHDPNPACNNGAQAQYDPSLKNILGFGDNTIHLGRYIAFLSTEVHSLGRNGQKQAQQRTLNELFLALQAYRRLDMTANQLWKMKMNACGQPGCSWQPDLSGYSGWFLRDDVPFDFHENFPADAPDEWKVGGIKSDYACRAAKLICDEFPKVASQDQVIGLLFGLAFVKRFVPAEAEVSISGTRYNVLNMAQKIAYGMVNRILKADGHKIRFPRCSEEPVEIGAETDWQLYGMIKVANFILPSGQQFDTTAAMKIAWEAARTGIFATNGWGKFFNVTMVLELIASGNINYNDTARKKADPDYFVMHFVWAALHNKTVSAAELDRMACTLCAYRCPGPCQQTDFYNSLPVGPPFACPNLPGGRSPGGGCEPRPWCKEFWINDLDCSRVAYHGQKFTPVSYLLAYNLFHLMRGTAYTHFYDPSHIETASQVPNAELSISGADSLLPEQAKTYHLKASPGATAYLWDTSPNLELVGIVDNDPRKVSVRALPNATGAAWIEAADPAIEDDGPCERSPRAHKSVWIGTPPSPPPPLNGVLPGKIATAPDDYCDRCASNPPAQVGQSLTANPSYVMGYHSGKSSTGMSAPYDGNGTLDHRQGLQRVYRDGKNYLIVSNSTLGKTWAGFETVELGSNPNEPFELYATLAQPGACPPNTDRIVRYTSRPFFTHADGIQVLGNRFLAIGYSRPDSQHPNDKPQWCLYDLKEPHNPVRLSCTPVGMGWAGAVALTRLNTGRYMAWVFGDDAQTVEIFTADSPQSFQWQSHGVFDPFGSDWNAYQGIQFVTGCDGRLYLAATHNNGGGDGNGEDWLDLWQVTFEGNSIAKPRVEKAAKRHMYCSNDGTGDVRYCNFKAGAGAYVTSEGHLLLYGVEHHNDICGGKGVKWREFPNAANGH